MILDCDVSCGWFMYNNVFFSPFCLFKSSLQDAVYSQKSKTVDVLFSGYNDITITSLVN